MNSLHNMRWSPDLYSKVAVIAQKAGNEMLSRLDWMTLKPQMILDIGCGTGEVTSRLKTYYANAHVLGIDISEDMLHHAKHSNEAVAFIGAEGGKLPLRDKSVDLIFANLLLPWVKEVAVILSESRRVLRPQGILMLTTLGLDTMQEWQTFFAADEMPNLVDMHDLGDLLLQEKFSDPVLDVTHFTLSYRNQESLLKELKGSGMLVSRDASTSIHLPDIHQGKWEVTYEVIHAHAFLEEESFSRESETRIPLGTLKQKLVSML